VYRSVHPLIRCCSWVRPMKVRPFLTSVERRQCSPPFYLAHAWEAMEKEPALWGRTTVTMRSSLWGGRDLGAPLCASPKDRFRAMT